MLFRFVIAAVAVCSAAAQTGKPGAVRGSVVATTGEPLRKAEVTMRAVGGGRESAPPRGMPGPERFGSPGNRAVFIQTTDATGTFAFDNIPAGSYQIHVQRNGYVRSVTGHPVTVASGETVTGITLKMSPHSVVAGRVLDEDGDPMANVTVQVLRERWSRGRRQLTPASADSTNDLGEYRIAAILPGSYYLVASYGRQANPAARARPAGNVADLRYSHQFYPAAADLAQAVPLRLLPGQEMRGMDFQLRKTPAFRVRGRVLDEKGQPATGVGLNAIPVDGFFLGSRGAGVARNAEGAFELGGLAPGTYTIVANRQGRDRIRTSAQQTITVGNRDIDGVVIQLQAPVSVSGVITLPEGIMPSAPTRVVLERVGSAFPFGGGNVTAQVDPGGSWTAQNVIPGRYRITVTPLPAGSYLKSVSASGQDVTAGAEITGTVAGIEVRLGPKAPEVTGVTVGADRQPVEGATVVFVPDSTVREQHWLFRTAATDEKGAFRVSGLTPGRYTVFAFQDVEDGQWFNPAFLQQIESRGTGIRLEEGSAETMQVTVTGIT